MGESRKGRQPGQKDDFFRNSATAKKNNQYTPNNKMELIEKLIERAKADKQRIVLPEGTEERTLKAANQILTDGVADLSILGNVDEIHQLARQ